MSHNHDTLMKNPEYRDAFFMYFKTVGRNRRYANIYKRKMEKMEKDFLQSN